MADDKKNKRPDADTERGPITEIPVGGEENEVPSKEMLAPAPDPIEVLRARVAELEDQRLRALAEIDNTRKRMTRQIDEALRSANDRLLLDLLDVADNLERAMKHAAESEISDEAHCVLKEGTELIYNQLMGVLSRYEVTPMEVIGRTFDPAYHDALAHIESDEFPENSVAAEINRGYMIGGRVLRHARVAVSKGAPASGAEDTQDD